ncbi:hypothetical protein F4561_000835 [Lipingzhangella halophila]|uniref:Uncharacterized protein n=1 Tax=Lipingzhangella halophila TaxID=1783352 RepID=A0A7W7W1T9_9ACTN|nr:hypothetical protein [Lipingzhangella halophila]MBB4930015.1 hypothetical protein [Lipingzhangella halophila]
MTRKAPLALGALAVTALLFGCSPEVDRVGEEEKEPLPEETPEAFTEFSDIQLPENPEELEISVDRNRFDKPRYRIHMTGTVDDVDEVCGQVGNYLRRSKEDWLESEAEELDVPTDEIEDVDLENVYGCGAVIQSSGADIDALVLKPAEDDGGTATLYLHAAPFQT